MAGNAQGVSQQTAGAEAPLQLQLSRGMQAPAPAKPVAMVVEPAPVVAEEASSWQEAALLAGGLIVATVVLGWFWWRRRVQSAPLPESMLWATDQSPSSVISIPFYPSSRSVPSSGGGSASPKETATDEVVPTQPGEDPPAAGAPGVEYPEASISELHDLRRRLKEYRVARNSASAIRMLSRHIQARKRTSPWVFLELLLLLQREGNVQPWAQHKLLFQLQFGQTAPDEAVPLRPDALEDDIGLCLELTRLWPSTSTRVWIERWLLGTGSPIGSGPPLLALQVYRDLLWLDEFIHYMARIAIEKKREQMRAQA